MASMPLFSVLDKKVGAHTPPFMMRSNAEAIRSFIDAVADKNQQFCKHPEDYILVRVGTFNEEKGVLIGPDTPEILISAVECMVQA